MSVWPVMMRLNWLMMSGSGPIVSHLSLKKVFRMSFGLFWFALLIFQTSLNSFPASLGQGITWFQFALKMMLETTIYGHYTSLTLQDPSATVNPRQKKKVCWWHSQSAARTLGCQRSCWHRRRGWKDGPRDGGCLIKSDRISPWIPVRVWFFLVRFFFARCLQHMGTFHDVVFVSKAKASRNFRIS